MGMQHPIVLVIRKSDMKLVSVSKKKVVVYESMYIAPLSYSSAKLNDAICERESSPALTAEERNDAKPTHVQQIKSISTHQVPIPNTNAYLSMRPPTQLDASADTQSSSQGGGLIVPEHLSYNNDLATGIEALRKKAETTISDPGIRKRVIDSITNLRNTSSQVVPQGQLKVGKKTKMKVDVANILPGKRKRVSFVEDKVEPSKKKTRDKSMRAKFGLKPGDVVSVAPEAFDGKEPGNYSGQNPGRCFGIIKQVWAGRKLAQVEYDNGSKYLHKYEQLRVEKLKDPYP